MNRYERYKDSGIPWLGEVPEHWEIIKNKYILAFSKGLTITKENLVDDGIPCVSYGEIHSKYGFEVNPEKHLLKCVSEEYLENNDNAYLKNGDFVFADTSEDVKGSGNFTYLNSNLSVFAGYHTIVARPDLRKVLPRYLAYVFDSDAHRNQIRAMVKGVKVFSITQAFLKNTFVWLPSLEEQTAIAHYLDTKLGEIDALIGKQQTLLEKLAEQRTAVITHAVTKGLNPAAPMKNSGVEWLGDVPAHWEMKAIKRVVKEHAGNGFPIELQGNNGDVPFLKVSDLNKGGKLLEDFANSVTRNIIYEMKWNIVPKFSLVTAKIGEALKKNHRKIISQDSIIDNNCIAFECLGINLDYHYYLSLIIDFDWFENGGTVPSLSVQKYKNQKICIPSLEEQTAIADYLDQETAKIDRLCETVNQTIGRLKEYRTALITQAVTGKIKVTDE